MMRRAGISLRVGEHPEYHEKYDQISHDWIECLSRLSVMPILIPNVYPDCVKLAKSLDIDLLLLSGGNNVGPIERRREIQNIPDVSLARDKTEVELIEYALESRIPILGVCRGMQMINVYFDGTLERDLKSIFLKPNSHVCEQHEIKIIHEGVRAALDLDRVHTNSYHRQAILLEGLGHGLKPFALGEGDIIEGFYHSELQVLGIQWHPERKRSNSVLDKLVLKAWLDSSSYRSVFS